MDAQPAENYIENRKNMNTLEEFLKNVKDLIVSI